MAFMDYLAAALGGGFSGLASGIQQDRDWRMAQAAEERAKRGVAVQERYADVSEARHGLDERQFEWDQSQDIAGRDQRIMELQAELKELTKTMQAKPPAETPEQKRQGELELYRGKKTIDQEFAPPPGQPRDKLGELEAELKARNEAALNRKRGEFDLEREYGRVPVTSRGGGGEEENLTHLRWLYEQDAERNYEDEEFPGFDEWLSNRRGGQAGGVLPTPREMGGEESFAEGMGGPARTTDLELPAEQDWNESVRWLTTAIQQERDPQKLEMLKEDLARLLEAEPQ